MMKYFSKRESNYFIRKYEVNGVMGFILMIWDERKLNFQMPFRDLLVGVSREFTCQVESVMS